MLKHAVTVALMASLVAAAPATAGSHRHSSVPATQLRRRSAAVEYRRECKAKCHLSYDIDAEFCRREQPDQRRECRREASVDREDCIAQCI